MSEEVDINPQALPKAIPATKRRISIIWLLPIIAAAIGGWLFYKSIINAPVKVVIEFRNSEGIMVDKTKVLYKGLPAGKVSEVELNRKGDAVWNRLPPLSEVALPLILRIWVRLRCPPKIGINSNSTKIIRRPEAELQFLSASLPVRA
jgi:hypothetical protein